MERERERRARRRPLCALVHRSGEGWRPIGGESWGGWDRCFLGYVPAPMIGRSAHSPAWKGREDPEPYLPTPAPFDREPVFLTSTGRNKHCDGSRWPKYNWTFFKQKRLHPGLMRAGTLFQLKLHAAEPRMRLLYQSSWLCLNCYHGFSFKIYILRI